MRIASDQYVNGARPTGEAEPRECIELRVQDGSVWVQLSVEGGKFPTVGQLITAEGEEPQAVQLVANPCGVRPTVPLVVGAAISARPGYPRLIAGVSVGG